MEKMLFIDACMRGPEVSRTYQICQAFLEAYSNGEVLHRDLTRADLPMLTGQGVQEREKWLEQQPEHPMLAYAREMAEADCIVVGAPYWDLAFPAALKAYLEWTSIVGVTFRYTPEGAPQGLCRAKALVYITSVGGPVFGPNLGYEYVKALSAMFGIRQTYCITAENLDVQGMDVGEILNRAKGEARQLAQKLQA